MNILFMILSFYKKFKYEINRKLSNNFYSTFKLSISSVL